MKKISFLLYAMLVQYMSVAQKFYIASDTVYKLVPAFLNKDHAFSDEQYRRFEMNKPVVWADTFYENDELPIGILFSHGYKKEHTAFSLNNIQPSEIVILDGKEQSLSNSTVLNKSFFPTLISVLIMSIIFCLLRAADKSYQWKGVHLMNAIYVFILGIGLSLATTMIFSKSLGTGDIAYTAIVASIAFLINRSFIRKKQKQQQKIVQ